MATTMISGITKIPGIHGGDACIQGHRIPVWVLVGFRNLGFSDAKVLESYPSITQTDLNAAWRYYDANSEEIDDRIRENEEDDEAPE